MSAFRFIQIEQLGSEKSTYSKQSALKNPDFVSCEKSSCCSDPPRASITVKWRKSPFIRRQSGNHFDLSSHSSPYLILGNKDLEFSWTSFTSKLSESWKASKTPYIFSFRKTIDAWKTWTPARPRSQKAWHSFGNIQNSWDCYFCLKVKWIKSNIIWDL